jgi:hypothetical protein
VASVADTETSCRSSNPPLGRSVAHPHLPHPRSNGRAARGGCRRQLSPPMLFHNISVDVCWSNS